MVERRTAVVDGRPTEVILPDVEWFEEAYREYASRFFSRWWMPEPGSPEFTIRTSRRMSETFGKTLFGCMDCGGFFRVKVEEATTPRPEHVGRDIRGGVWFPDRSEGYPWSAIAMGVKEFMPERVWRHVLVHEMVHLACYWNSLWAGEGHDGWFLDIADAIRADSGGEFDIQRYVPLDMVYDKEDVEAEGMSRGSDYGLALRAVVELDGRKFPVMWRCPSLEAAKSAIRSLYASRRAPFDGVPAKLSSVSVYEFDRGNVRDRGNRHLVRARYSALPDLPGGFPAGMPGADALRASRLNSALVEAGVARPVWTSAKGFTDEYRARHGRKRPIGESFIGDAVSGIGRGISRLVRAVVGALWGPARRRDVGDGHAEESVA